MYEEVHRAHAQYYSGGRDPDRKPTGRRLASSKRTRAWTSAGHLREACAWATEVGEITLGAGVLLPLVIPIIYRLTFRSSATGRSVAVSRGAGEPSTHSAAARPAATIIGSAADYAASKRSLHGL